MPYTCELESGQTVYLDNQGSQTVITIASRGMGQQQQASNRFSTGNWTSPPEIYHTAGGAILKISTAQGEHCILIQGTSMSATSHFPNLADAQQIEVHSIAKTPVTNMPSMQPMQPMEPMKPMKMGNMEMNMNPMEMRMGNMEMRMGGSGQSTRQFCSQCGAKLEASDRFCASCGHRLS